MTTRERLHDIALRTGTDKARHGFLDFYEKHIDPASIHTVLEMGVKEGASLRMWREWLPDATIEGWDITPVEIEDCDVRIVNQDDREQMGGAAADHYDLIVDDAGHWMRGQQTSLSFLFPRCHWFIMEDLHTSWIPKYFEAEDVSTYDLIMNLETAGWPSKWATDAEAEYLAANAELVGVHTRGLPEQPRSASAVLRNTLTCPHTG